MMQTHLELDSHIGVTRTIPASRLRIMTGRVLSGFAAAFLLVDGVVKLFPIQAVIESSQQLGYQADTIFTIGLVLLACVALYLIPPTSALGALMLTGYLGGAVATHVRVGNPLFSHVLFPIYVAVLIWAGLVLRQPTLWVLLGGVRSRRSRGGSDPS